MCKSKICLCIVAVMFYCHLFSQQKEEVQGLINVLENTTNPQERLLLLDSLSKEISQIRSTNFNFYQKKYSKYSLEYIDLAKELDSFDLAVTKTSELVQHYFRYAGRLDSANIIVNHVFADSNKIRKRINLGQLYTDRAFVNFLTADLKKAIVDYQRAAKIFQEENDTIAEANALYYSGHTYQRLGNLTEAILSYQKSTELYTKLKDTSAMASSKISISYIFSQLSLIDEALKERRSAKVLLDAQKETNYISLSRLKVMDYRDLAKQKKYEEAESSLLQALEFSKKGTSSIELAFNRAFLSVFYSKHKKQPEVAKKYIDTISQDKRFLNSPEGKILYLDVMSELEMAKGRFQDAIPFLEDKLTVFKQRKDIQAQVDVEECLYKSYQQINKHSDANTHLERYITLKDSMYNIKRSNSIIYYQTLYETEKNQSKIAAQKASIEILEEKDKAKRNLILFGGIGLSLLFLSVYLYRNRVYLLRNKKLQQSFLQELLQTQERVSKRISKDLHDSVGQSLLLIKNRVLQNNDEKTANSVDDVIDEVRSISRTLHPFKLEELGLTVTLESSVERIDENYDIFISAEIDNIDKVFDQEEEINIYRLVQESFNNILKHSNARSAEIKVVNKDDNVEIIITDNGKGFDVSKEKISSSKIGLKTLAERSKFLKASFNILSEIDQGTTLIFNIPKHV